MTPLERPAQWAGKEVPTQEEADAYEKQTIGRRDENDAVTAGPDWWELENNVLKNRRTSLLVDPATAASRRRQRNTRHGSRRRAGADAGAGMPTKA